MADLCPAIDNEYPVEDGFKGCQLILNANVELLSRYQGRVGSKVFSLTNL